MKTDSRTNRACSTISFLSERPQRRGSAGSGMTRSEQIKALFAGGRTMTSSQVAATTGLGLAMTNRYLARLLAAGELVATAPPRSPKRAYRANS